MSPKNWWILPQIVIYKSKNWFLKSSCEFFNERSEIKYTQRDFKSVEKTTSVDIFTILHTGCLITEVSKV